MRAASYSSEENRAVSAAYVALAVAQFTGAKLKKVDVVAQLVAANRRRVADQSSLNS